jgi:mono/diheme cytochrome c family protein
MALAVALLVTWLLARPLSEVDRSRRQFAQLQRAVTDARESRTARAADRGRILRLRAQARAANDAQRPAFEAEAAGIEARIGWGDSDAVRAAVLSEALIPVRRTPRAGGAASPSTGRTRGCVACHVTIAAAGYENYPSPFRTHPRLSSYVGADSPHPPSRVRCESCHRGDGDAATFSTAGHSTLDSGSRTGAAGGRRWTDPHATTAMLPAGRVEAGCVTCHSGERYQPGAPDLNEALVTLERGGCYACHNVPGMENTPRRGPDLRRIASKLSPEWVRAWLQNPRAIKPATWMPRLWTGDPMSADDAAAIEAVTAYLFANSQEFAPAVANPPRGDVSRGKAVVESVGCLGCHVAGDAVRDQSSPRRTFGQPLEGVGAKTTYAWLFDWLREPSRYSSGTRMPNLRLTAVEAADAATYLTSLSGDVPRPASEAVADERYRAVIGRYAEPSARQGSGAELSGRPLAVMAGRVVIGAVGCANCHEIGGVDSPRNVAPITERTVWLAADVRNAHAAGAATASGIRKLTAPDFGLGPTEASRLALALTAVAGRTRAVHGIGTPWHLRKIAGRTLVQERNCVGCHAIEETGGDFLQLVAEPSLGPPPLTPEGSRVNRDWLHGFLRAPTTIRPWLSVRMPTFGLSDDHLARVSAYLAEIAPPNPPPSPIAPGSPSAGKELFETLKCQQCHVLGSIPAGQPTANLAPDLRRASERLQPEWIVAWLRNPSAILPGTRMPTFWPDYPKSYYPQLNRDGDAQIRALRDHLVTLR